MTRWWLRHRPRCIRCRQVLSHQFVHCLRRGPRKVHVCIPCWEARRLARAARAPAS